MKISRLLVITFTLCFSMLCSCTSSQISYDRYSLTENISSSSFIVKRDLNVELNEVLNDGGIVLKTSNVSLLSANNHRWASSLKEQLRVILNDALNKANVREDLSLNIYVCKFYGTTDGHCIIDMTVDSFKKGKALYTKNYSFNRLQNKDGYQALVDTLKSGFESLSEEIANDLSMIK